MARTFDCPSCCFGSHEKHVENWDPAPPDVLGGTVCICNGDCVERNKASLERLMRAIFPEGKSSE